MITEIFKILHDSNPVNIKDIFVNVKTNAIENIDFTYIAVTRQDKEVTVFEF